MRIWFPALFIALLAVIALAGPDTPDVYGCPPSGGHHGNFPYGSMPRQYVYDDSDQVLLSRDLDYDCRSTQCRELHTDYKNTYTGLCQAATDMLETTECENFCFYAVCLNCTLSGHLHPRHPHTHANHCDDCSGSHTHWHRSPTVYHSWIRSPCTSWHWRIFDPVVDAQVTPKEGRNARQDYSMPPNIAQTLEFGMVPPGYSPDQPECVDERGGIQDFDGGLTSLPASSNFGENAHKADLMTGVRPHPDEISVSDLTHLPVTPGEPGAPRLVSVTKIDDTTVRLNVSGGVNTEYRYWTYNGIRGIDRDPVSGLVVGPDEEPPLLVGTGWNPGRDDSLVSPLVFRLPFEPLSGNIVIDPGIRGIVSFQVRSVDASGVPSGLSNVEHEMIGVGGLRSIGPNRANLRFSVPLPPPPPDSTPLPTPPPPAVLPPTPVSPAVSQVVNLLGDVDLIGAVDIDLRGSYAGYTVEYRIWDHSGFDPWDVDDVPDLSIPWVRSPVTSGTFRVTGVLDDVEYPIYDPVNPVIPTPVPPPATPAFELPTPTPWPTRTPSPLPWLQTPFPTPEPTPLFPSATVAPTPAPIPVPAHFNVQVRLIDSNGLEGNPSAPVVVRVWSGFYTGWDR